MGNVAIVGVEGSGKTALMVSWGWHYQSPDRNGYYLSPDPKGGNDTLSSICSEMNRMRGGNWPYATTPDSVTKLDWLIGRKGSSIGEMSFMDFGGELYRQAFGNGSEATLKIKDRTPLENDTPVVRLQRHVKNCTALVILVDLGYIIDNPLVSNPRVQQMIGVIKTMIEMMRQRLKIGRVALVFSQADRYASILEREGSLTAAYRNYLPAIASHYPKLSLFAVSAVNKTIPDDAGRSVPAADFQAEGLEKLTAWVALQQLKAACWDNKILAILCVVPVINIGAFIVSWGLMLMSVAAKIRFWKARGWRIKRTK